MDESEYIILFTEVAALTPCVTYAAVGIFPYSEVRQSVVGSGWVFGKSKYRFVPGDPPSLSVYRCFDPVTKKCYADTGRHLDYIRKPQPDRIMRQILRASNDEFEMYSDRVLPDDPPVFVAHGRELHPSVHDVKGKLLIECLADLPDVQTLILGYELHTREGAKKVQNPPRQGFQPGAAADVNRSKGPRNFVGSKLRKILEKTLLELHQVAAETPLSLGQWLPISVDVDGVRVPGAALIQSVDPSGKCEARLYLTEQIERVPPGAILQRWLDWSYQGRNFHWQKDIATVEDSWLV